MPLTSHFQKLNHKNTFKTSFMNIILLILTEILGFIKCLLKVAISIFKRHHKTNIIAEECTKGP